MKKLTPTEVAHAVLVGLAAACAGYILFVCALSF